MNILKAFVTILFLLLPFALLAQITIAPTNLFIEDNSRFGSFMVINNSDGNQEVSVQTIFGYFESDSVGNKTFVQDTTEIAEKYSIKDYVRAFPQNFVLTPNQRQIVRLRVSAPSNLDDGTYWARIKTSTRTESAPIELDEDQTIGARIGVVIEQVTGLFYKVGETTTGIEVESLVAELVSDNFLQVTSEFNRFGNSPFLGSIFIELINSNGLIEYSKTVSTSFYFDGVFRDTVPIEDLSPGQYTVKIRFETRRSDISSSDLVQMEPETATTTVTIP